MTAAASPTHMKIVLIPPSVRRPPGRAALPRGTGRPARRNDPLAGQHSTAEGAAAQGQIGPPRSIDLEAAPEWKAKLEGDPFATLPPESAAVLRRNMDTLVTLWSDVVGLTAQHGR